jgi:hypothetical protein
MRADRDPQTKSQLARDRRTTEVHPEPEPSVFQSIKKGYGDGYRQTKKWAKEKLRGMRGRG